MLAWPVLILAVGAEAAVAANPLLAEWTTPFGVPPFEQIEVRHFMPALEAGMAEQRREVAAIAAQPEAPTFANTIEALDASGEVIERVRSVFFNRTSAETNDELQAISKSVAPKLAALRDDIFLDDKLFARVESVWNARQGLTLDAEKSMLLERTYKEFVRGGAKLAGKQKERLRAVNAELAELGVKFSDNLLRAMNAFRLVVGSRADLAGLPERVVTGAAEVAKKAGLEGKWVFTLHAPSLTPFLQFADNRDLRRKMYEAYTTRNDHGDAADNKALLARVAVLRAERAKLLGFATHADYVLDENMAKTPAKVYELLHKLWTPAKGRAREELRAMQAIIDAEKKGFALAPWDWVYYAEKLRKAKYALDDQELRPYFQLDKVRDGAFQVANRLYGITFTPLTGMPVYHPEVRAFEVKDADGAHLAVFYADYHPRPGKRGGAWSSRYRGQYWRAGQEVRPVVVNVCNFSRPAGDTPALLSLEEVETLFHELGHGLHAILSKIHYRTLSSVPRDFAELPSQIMENWALEPQVLALYARHHQTGEVMPPALVERITKAKQFNMGFATVEYLAAALLDMDWHTLKGKKAVEPASFEKAALAKIGMPAEIRPRYRSTYFQHIFSGGYSAGYYSYIWSEVLDSDAFELFKQRGVFDAATARSFRDNVLSRGGTEEAMTLYKRFRGAEPVIGPLLARRGLQ